ncbi:MAG: hypothetical protein H6975_04300 [Gammaproteobacteria bacterium]|nr:hypothetical protein [Gammaproteobacteria bacterium]
MEIKIPIERHQAVSLLIFAGVSVLITIRDGIGDEALARIFLLLVFLVPLLLYRVVAYLSSFGFMEFFASDYGSRNSAGPYAFFFWLLFLIACLFQIFEWSIY